MRGKDLLECMEYIDDTLIEEALNPASSPHNKNSMVKNWSLAAACVIMLCIFATAFWSHQKQQKIEYTEEPDLAVQMDSVSNDAGDLSLPAEHTSGGTLAQSAATDTDLNPAGRDNETEKAIEDKALSMQTPVHAEQYDEAEKGAIVEEKQKTAYTVLSDYYGEKDDAVYDYPMPEKGALLCYHYLQETINYYTKQGKAADSVDGTIYAFQVVIDLYGDIETAEGIRYEDLYYTEKGHALIEQEYRRLIDLGYAVRLSEDFQLTGTFTKTEIDTFQAAPEYGYVFRFEGET